MIISYLFNDGSPSKPIKIEGDTYQDCLVGILNHADNSGRSRIVLKCEDEIKKFLKMPIGRNMGKEDYIFSEWIRIG